MHACTQIHLHSCFNATVSLHEACMWLQTPVLRYWHRRRSAVMRTSSLWWRTEVLHVGCTGTVVSAGWVHKGLQLSNITVHASGHWCTGLDMCVHLCICMQACKTVGRARSDQASAWQQLKVSHTQLVHTTCGVMWCRLRALTLIYLFLIVYFAPHFYLSPLPCLLSDSS